MIFYIFLSLIFIIEIGFALIIVFSFRENSKKTKNLNLTTDNNILTTDNTLDKLENNIFMLIEGTFGQQIQVLRQLLEQKFQKDSLLKERTKLDLIPLLEKYIKLTEGSHILIETKPDFNYSEEDEK